MLKTRVGQVHWCEKCMCKIYHTIIGKKQYQFNKPDNVLQCTCGNIVVDETVEVSILKVKDTTARIERKL